MSVSTKYYLYIVHKFIFKCFYLRINVCMYNSFNTQIFECAFITYDVLNIFLYNTQANIEFFD